MRALLLLNEHSRKGGRDGDAVCRALDGCGVECDRDPAAQNVGAVIAAGGDGTIVRAIPKALELGVPLGIVPLGTFNDLAHTLGIPLEKDGACAAIAGAKTRRIDVGRVNDVYFVNEASVGVSTRIARRQTPEIKQRFGLLAIVMTTLQAVRETRPFTVHLQYAGASETFKTVQLTIANSGHFGGIIDRQGATCDDGWLDLYSVEVRSWMQALGLVRNILRRDADHAQGLRTRRAHKFGVQTHRPHHITADGEPAGMTPAVFEVLPHALEVLIP